MKKSVGSSSRFMTGITILISILFISNSCTKDTTYDTSGSGGGPKGTGPGTNEVWIKDMAFTPATITVAAGTTIKWTNKDGIGHTVTSKTGVFDSGTIGGDGTFTFKFTTAGTFPYICTTHPTMTGSVVVQ
jgi:plastocyanin